MDAVGSAIINDMGRKGVVQKGVQHACCHKGGDGVAAGRTERVMVGSSTGRSGGMQQAV